MKEGIKLENYDKTEKVVYIKDIGLIVYRGNYSNEWEYRKYPRETNNSMDSFFHIFNEELFNKIDFSIIVGIEGRFVCPEFVVVPKDIFEKYIKNPSWGYLLLRNCIKVRIPISNSEDIKEIVRECTKIGKFNPVVMKEMYNAMSQANTAELEKLKEKVEDCILEQESINAAFNYIYENLDDNSKLEIEVSNNGG